MLTWEGHCPSCLACAAWDSKGALRLTGLVLVQHQNDHPSSRLTPVHLPKIFLRAPIQGVLAQLLLEQLEPFWKPWNAQEGYLVVVPVVQRQLDPTVFHEDQEGTGHPQGPVSEPALGEVRMQARIGTRPTTALGRHLDRMSLRDNSFRCFAGNRKVGRRSRIRRDDAGRVRRTPASLDFVAVSAPVLTVAPPAVRTSHLVRVL